MDFLFHAQRRIQGLLLREAGKTYPGRIGDAATIGFLGSAQQAQQGGFSGAIGA